MGKKGIHEESTLPGWARERALRGVTTLFHGLYSMLLRKDINGQAHLLRGGSHYAGSGNIYIQLTVLLKFLKKRGGL